ncbi:hypothetical protein SO802_007451 [Lithocarpus litseifolius]|uniref:Uncharacterized protein n=1 Tax=Lithocarpus litseifolius TaxID=425828 RepID=A0AAW2DRX4_9ROSI
MQISMFVCERVVVLTGGAAERGTRGGFESRRLGGPAWGWVIEGDDVGRGFAGVEVGRGELGSGVDFDEASVVGFFGGVVAVAGSGYSLRSGGDRSLILLETSKSTHSTQESTADF